MSRSWVNLFWRRKWQPTPVNLPGEFHGQRSLAGYSPWVCKESGMTEQLSLTHFFPDFVWNILHIVSLYSKMNIWCDIIIQVSDHCCCCCCVASVLSNSVRPHRRQPTRHPDPGILQARTLEWVAISFSNAWKWKVKVKSLSRVQHLATPWTAAYQALPSMGFSRQKYWSGVPLPSLFWSLERLNYLPKVTQ